MFKITRKILVKCFQTLTCNVHNMSHISNITTPKLSEICKPHSFKCMWKIVYFYIRFLANFLRNNTGQNITENLYETPVE